MIALLKTSSGSIYAVEHQILSKSNNIFTEIWWFNDFQNGGGPPSWILKICSFCHVAFVAMPFCFFTQNFGEIGKSVDELWPQKRFWRWRAPPSWVSKFSIFGHVTVMSSYLMQCTKFHQNRTIFHGDMAILRFLKWRPSAILDFKNLQFLSCSPCRHAILLPHTKFHWNRTIGWWVMAKKVIFKMAGSISNAVH